MGRYGNRPAAGFPYLIAVFALLLAVPEAHAITAWAVPASRVSQAVFAETEIVCFDPAVQPLAGIMTDTISGSAGSIFSSFLASALPEAQYTDLPDTEAMVQDEELALPEADLPILPRLASLPLEPVAWLLVLTPWLWSLAIWRRQPPQFHERRRPIA